MLRRGSPLLTDLSGGGQEFQEQSPWDRLPEDLYAGPPPPTQTVLGPGGAVAVGPVSDLAVPFTSRLSPAAVNRFADDWQRTLLNAVQQKGNFQQTSGTVGTSALLIRKAESRIYFIIQNTSIANLLFVAFGYPPQVLTGGATGFQLNANGGNYEPKIIPQQDVWVIGNAASVPWVMAVVVD